MKAPSITRFLDNALLVAGSVLVMVALLHLVLPEYWRWLAGDDLTAITVSGLVALAVGISFRIARYVAWGE